MNNPFSASLSETDQQIYRRVCWDFDQHWSQFLQARGGSGSTVLEPQLEQYLNRGPQEGGPLRRALLVELVRMDLEYRRKLDQSRTPDDYIYIQDFHALSNNSQAIAYLRAERADVPADDALSQTFLTQHYDSLELIGQGGFGRVYKARHRELDELHAVKVIPLSTRVGQESSDEAKLMAAMNHDNVVKVRFAASDPPNYYLAMEYVGGDNLDAYVRRNRCLPWRDACTYTYQAATGLGYLHTVGVIHRDVKPSNLILSPRLEGTRPKRIVIVDLGLAVPFRLGHAIGGCGTQEYMAPEQFDVNRTISCAADIYSLGCTLYFLLTGTPPFGTRGESFKHRLREQHENSQPPLPAGIPSALKELLLRMLHKDETKRPSTAEVIEELRGIGRGPVALPALRFDSQLTVRNNLSPEEREYIYAKELDARGEEDGFYGDCKPCKALKGWGENYPPGLFGLFNKKDKSPEGWAGIWPITQEMMIMFMNGQLCEDDLDGSSMKQFGQTQAPYWYIGGVSLCVAESELALEMRFRSFLGRCIGILMDTDRIRFPVEVLVLGYRETHSPMEESLGLKRIRETEQMRDKCPLYFRKFEKEQLQDLRDRLCRVSS